MLYLMREMWERVGVGRQEGDEGCLNNTLRYVDRGGKCGPIVYTNVKFVAILKLLVLFVKA